MPQSLSAYRIFYTVAKTQNISKAAKELYISQPAISKSIRKLEENLGCPLFRRSSRGVTLTEEGELLFTHVRSAFETLSRGEDKLKNSLDNGAGHLKIGVSSTLCKYMLLPYLREFTRRRPHINISIACQSTNESLRMLEEDRLDIGLIARPETQQPLRFDRIGEIEDIFVASQAYLDILRSRNISSEDILPNSTLMLLDKQNMTRQYIDDYLREHRIGTGDLIEVSSMELLIDFARTNLGVACVIRQFVQQELDSGELLEIPLGFPIHKREIGFAYRENVQPSRSLELFLEFCRGFQPA